MPEILTVTLNPALDIATTAPQVTAGHKLRCSDPQIDPGGGGINVARAIIQLGGQATAFVALGGDTGAHLRRLLDAAGIPVIAHTAPGDTRQSLAVTDLSINNQFRFMLPGPNWSDADVVSASTAICANAPKGGYVVLSGSGPSGTTASLYSQLCADLAGCGVQVVVDTSGAALSHLAEGHAIRPHVLRMDQVEAQENSATPLTTRTDTADFASGLVAKGAAKIVIIARGADGNILSDGTNRWFCPAVNVTVKSKVGAGDSFVGGFTWALAQGHDLPTALAHGSAAASAACMTEGTELCRKDDFAECLARTEPSPL